MADPKDFHALVDRAIASRTDDFSLAKLRGLVERAVMTSQQMLDTAFVERTHHEALAKMFAELSLQRILNLVLLADSGVKIADDLRRFLAALHQMTPPGLRSETADADDIANGFRAAMDELAEWRGGAEAAFGAVTAQPRRTLIEIANEHELHRAGCRAREKAFIETGRALVKKLLDGPDTGYAHERAALAKLIGADN